MNVVIYTTKTCTTCKSIEEQLRRNGIDFEERDMGETDVYVALLMASSQMNTQRCMPPVLCVDGRFIEEDKEMEWMNEYLREKEK